MKKNYKFVSAAAAALLAVAPVATSAVTSFAAALPNHVIGNQTTTNTSTTSFEPFSNRIGTKSTSSSLDLSQSQTLSFNKGVMNNPFKASDLTLTNKTANGKTYTYSVDAVSSIANVYDDENKAISAAKDGAKSSDLYQGDKLEAGKTYYVVFSADVTVPEARYTKDDVTNNAKKADGSAVTSSDEGKSVDYKFTFGDGNEDNVTGTASDSSKVTNVPVVLKVTAYDSTIKQQPYFSIAKGEQSGLKLGDGDTVPVNTGAQGVVFPASGKDKNGNAIANVADLLNTAKSYVHFHESANDALGKDKDSDKDYTHDNEITTTEADVASQLQKQGFTVTYNKDAKSYTVTIPNSSKAFNVTLTGTNKYNHKTVTVKVPFSTNYNYLAANAPAIWDSAVTTSPVAVGSVNLTANNNNVYTVKQSANGTFNAREFTTIDGNTHSFTGTVLAGSDNLKHLLQANNKNDNTDVGDVKENKNGLSLVLDRAKSDVVDLSKVGTYNIYLTATADQFTPVTTYHYVVNVQAKETTTVHVNNTTKTNENQYAPLYHIYNSGDVAAITSENNAGKVRETSVKDGTEVYVIGNTKTIDGKEYTQVVTEKNVADYNKAHNTSYSSLNDVKKNVATSDDYNNIWIESKYLKQPATEAASTGVKTIMHAAYVYDQNGQKTSSKLSAYSTTDTYGTKKINGKTYYAINSAQTKFVVKGNIDGTSRKLTKNAYVYNNKGKRIKSQGKLKKGTTQTTYGASYTIKGKTYYRIGKGHYVKVANFR